MLAVEGQDAEPDCCAANIALQQLGQPAVLAERPPEVAGLAGDETRAVEMGRRRDQGVRDQDAVALAVAAAVGAAEPGDFQVDAVNHQPSNQALDPMITEVSSSQAVIGGSCARAAAPTRHAGRG